MTEDVYVRRRRWSWVEKRSIVSEAETSGNVMASAKRYRIQARQICRWRERVMSEGGAPGFIPVAVEPSNAVMPVPAPVLDRDLPIQSPAAVSDHPRRIDITLRSGHRLIVEGRFDLAAILALARGLEAGR